MTLNQIKALFKQSISNDIIKTFTYGDLINIDFDETTFPLLNSELETSNKINDTEIERTFFVTILDLVEEDLSNKDEVLNDTELYCSTVINYFNNEVNVVEVPQITEIKDYNNNLIYGYQFLITFQTNISGDLISNQSSSNFECEDLNNCTEFTNLVHSVGVVQTNIEELNEDIDDLNQSIENIETNYQIKNLVTVIDSNDDTSYPSEKAVIDYVTTQTTTVTTTYTSNSSLTPVISNQLFITDYLIVTALATTSSINEPSGTPTNGKRLVMRIRDNGTSRSLTWNPIYSFSVELSSVAATTAGVTIYLGFIYNSTSLKWECVGQLNNVA